MANHESSDIFDVTGRPFTLNRSADFNPMELDELNLSDSGELTEAADCASFDTEFSTHHFDSSSADQSRAAQKVTEVQDHFCLRKDRINTYSSQNIV